MRTHGYINLPFPLTDLLNLEFLLTYFIIDYFLLLNKTNTFLHNKNLNLTEISYKKKKHFYIIKIVSSF